jgi:hypothetical protein
MAWDEGQLWIGYLPVYEQLMAANGRLATAHITS